jgi:hypothetical protein
MLAMSSTSRPLRRRAAGAAALAACVLAAAATPASADSIAYVKGGDVWLSTPDGSRQYRVTDDGGYSQVSQSDSGRIAALRGDRISTFNPDGSPIHVDGSRRYDILTPHSYTHPGTMFRGPFDPAISPDGMRIAYSWYYTQTGQTPNCNPSNGCQTVYGRQGTNYISPDGKSPFDQPGFNEQTGWVGPSWTSDGGTIISDPIQVGNPDAVVHTPGDQHNGIRGAMSPWFFDPSATGGLADGELTRDRTKLVFVTGQAHETLFLYRGNGGHPHVPENCYKLTDGTGRISSPSWSPDGTTLAFADDSGINVLPLPSFATDCGTPTAEHAKRLLIPGATSPDWGPADVPAGPGKGGGAGGGGGTGGGGTGGDTGGGGGTAKPDPKPDTAKPPRGPAITVRGSLRLSSVLRKGVTLRVSGLKAGARTALQVRYRKRTVARRTVKVGTTGVVSATLKLSAAGKRALKGKRSAVLELRAGAIRTTAKVSR